MRRGWLIAVMLAACSRDLQVPGLPGPGALQGHVVIAQPGTRDRLPAAGARIAQLQGPLRAHADAQGFFRLEGLTGPVSELLFQHDEDGDGLFERSRLLTLDALAGGLGVQVDLGEVVLSENGAVSGKATRGDVMASSGHSGSLVFVPGGAFAGLTADNGAYALEDVPEGTLPLSCFRAGYLPQSFERVQVGSGQRTVLRDIVLQLAPPDPGDAELTGTVTLSPSGDAAGLAVELVGFAGTRATASTLAGGAFTFSALKGDVYSVTVSRGAALARAVNVLVPPSAMRHVELVLDTAGAGAADPLPAWVGLDAGIVDAGQGDAGPADSGSTDSGTPDAGPSDSGTPDGGAVDSGSVDAGSDAGVVLGDAGTWLESFLNMPANVLDVSAVTFDSAGNVWVGASWLGILQRSPPSATLTRLGGAAGLVTQFASDHTVLRTWLLTHDGGQAIDLKGIVEVAPGELHVFAQTRPGTVSIDGLDYTVDAGLHSEMFGVRISSDGGVRVASRLQLTALTGTPVLDLHAMVADPSSGRIWAGGTYGTNGALYDPANPGRCLAGAIPAQRAVVHELGPDAGCQWIHGDTCTNNTSAQTFVDGLAFDPSTARLFVLGHIAGPCLKTTRFGSMTVSTPRYVQMHELASGPAATPSYVLQLGTLSGQYPAAIAAWGGRVWVAGAFSGTFSTLSGSVNADGGFDIAVVELEFDVSPSPVILGMRSPNAYGSRGNDWPVELRPDPLGRLHLVAQTDTLVTSPLELGGPALFAPASGDNLAVATFDVLPDAGFAHVRSLLLSGGDAGINLSAVNGFQPGGSAVGANGADVLVGRRPPNVSFIQGYVAHWP